MPKDKGWNYLNSIEDDSEDGSSEYQNDDGSGSYYGADGSWGYKNSDGSGSYYGADGSWGYKNSDGSVSYYGKDGTWGYKNADGSGAYYGSNNDCSYYDTSNNTENQDNSTDDANDDLKNRDHDMNSHFTYSSPSKTYHPTQKESSDDSGDSVLFTLIKRVIVSHPKASAIILAVLVLIGSIRYYQNNRISVGMSNQQLCEYSVEEAYDYLSSIGFSKIYRHEMKDLDAQDDEKEGTIFNISINDKNEFNDTSRFWKRDEISINYHTYKEKLIDAASIYKMNAIEAEEELKGKGFGNVRTESLNALIFGWLYDEGEISEIIINGEKLSKKSSDSFPVNAEIVIKYHSKKE